MRADNTTNTRTEERTSGSNRHIPARAVIFINGETYQGIILNYHFNGACIKLKKKIDFDKATDLSLDFYIGDKCLKSKMAFKLAWKDNTDEIIGIEFTKPLETNYITRSKRFLTHKNIKPTVVGCDPTDPNRLIYYSVHDLSESGMLLQTSITNKHLFPGMTIKDAKLTIPGLDSAELNLFIANVRKSKEENLIDIGVFLQGTTQTYKKYFQNYVSTLSPMTENRAEALSLSGFFSRSIKNGLTYRYIESAEEYKNVLKLRYEGYSKHGKIAEGKTWKDLGEGYDKEGKILAAYLGGQLVASAELRFGTEAPFRMDKYIDLMTIPNLNRSKVVEINKFVVHPKAQRSDIVLGMMQRIHAIVVTHGKIDVLLNCTEKLKPLYKNVGAKDLNLSYPHPDVPSTHLHAMLITHEVYEQGKDFNPYAWDIVFKNVNDYMHELGLTQKPHLSTKNKILKKVYTKVHSKRTKDANKPRTTQKRSNSTEFINPRWTKQHITSSIMLPYILEADELIGQSKVDSILATIEIPRSYFDVQGNWLSIEFLNTFNDLFSQHHDLTALQRGAGIRSMQKEILGINYYILKHFISLEAAFRQISKITPRFNKTRTYNLSEIRNGRAFVKIGVVEPELRPKHKETCENWKASFEATAKLITGKPAQVIKKNCCFNGDLDCTYEIIWEPQNKHILSNQGSNLLIVAISLLSYFLTKQPMTALATLMFFACIKLSRKLLKIKEEFNSITKEFDNYNKEAEEKYNELQVSKNKLDENYKESVIIDLISRDVQRSHKLDKILNSALDGICKNFDFDRAFIMLADNMKQQIKTAAISGIYEGAQDVWKFTIDVSQKRDNQQVASSVFLTSNSIMINNVDEHLFQLNDASKALINKLKTSGFCIVPIPAWNDTNWGILIADKSSKRKELDRRDLVLLQKVALHLGLALDKQANLDSEVKIRKIFEKFVPSSILSQVSAVNEPNLGGQTKNIACMFIDIRGFTQMTSALAPQTTLELLNIFYNEVYKVSNKYSGIIDKYLGDGVLLSWGAHQNTEGNALNAVKTGIEILQSLEKINDVNAKNGLPRIEIGIGIHQGPAIAGNVGSEERMEFTIIGNTVNIASRLEGLCKVYDCSMVISQEVLSSLPQDYQAQYELADAKIKGIDNHITVGINRKSKIKDVA